MQKTGNSKTALTASKMSPTHKGPPRIFVVLAAGIALAAAYLWWQNTQQQKPGLFVSGRLEGYETNIGAKVGGRVLFVKYREGEQVKRDELLVRINDEEIRAQLRGSEARMKQAMQQRDQSAAQIKVIQSQIAEARLSWAQSKEDTQGRIFQARSNVAQAESQLCQAEADARQSESDLRLATTRKERYARLLVKGAVTQDQYDQAATTFDTTKANVESRLALVRSAQRQLNAQQGLLTQALTTRLNPPMRGAQLSALEGQLQAAEAQLRAAEHAIASASAAWQEIQANISYLNIVSPINGIVTARPVEPGAVVAAGQTILSVIDLDTVYLRGFIPEGDIGRVRTGQKANVYLDSTPNKPFSGIVIEIDPVASFTPENIYFKNDRVKQVFGIKIGIANPAGYCKPGMPADAQIVTP